MYIEKKQFYNGDDIQRMLSYLKANKSARAKFQKSLKGYSEQDISHINFVIDECYAEEFDRYDSAVCEEFLNTFESCFLTHEGLPRFFVVSKSADKFKVIDLEDRVIETVSKKTLDDLVVQGVDIGGYNV